jgi:hypothetical protein
MKLLNIVIENCSDCPFYKFETLYDGICGRLYNIGVTEKVFPYSMSWMCPLRQYSAEGVEIK